MAVRPLRIAHVVSEASPWCKTGGLADVASALPRALRAMDAGVEVAVFLPLYRELRLQAKLRGAELKPAGVQVRVSVGTLDARAELYTPAEPQPVDVFFVDCPKLYDRHGLYGDETGVDHADNALRFGFLSLAALEAAPGLMGGEPHVFHAHDWQAGLLPLYLATRYRERLPGSRSLYTIHNLAFQGNFPRETVEDLGLDWSVYTPEGAEFWDQLSFMKAGVAWADAITTVSPSYAREIQTTEFGCGMEDFLAGHTERLSGILNGIDDEQWSPARDSHLPVRYDLQDLSGKQACRKALLQEMGLVAGDHEPLLGLVSRLSHQKGIDLVADLVPELPALGARLLMLSTGDPVLAEALLELQRAYPAHLAFHNSFDEGLSHRIHAGVDMFVMPSRFEPCGLNQMYAMNYGTPPVVHAVGGLKDTVIDAAAGREATGVVFAPATAEALLEAVSTAVKLYREAPQTWASMIGAGMGRDFSWQRSGREYLQLYDRLADEARA